MGKTQDIVDLLDKGFIPVSLDIPDGFCKRRRCGRKEKAEWFLRPRPKSSGQAKGICLGCKRRCAVVNPPDWPEIHADGKAPRPGLVAFSLVERISVDDLLRLKRVLRVDEAAWALSVSRQTVHRWVEEGRLEQVAGSPLRVTSHSVERFLLPLDGAG